MNRDMEKKVTRAQIEAYKKKCNKIDKVYADLVLIAGCPTHILDDLLNWSSDEDTAMKMLIQQYNQQ